MSKALLKDQNKFRSVVRCDMRRNAMLGEYMDNKEFCQLSRSNGVESGNKNGFFVNWSTTNRIAV